MTRYQKIGTIIGAIIALVVMITIRSRLGIVWGIKLLVLGFIYIGNLVGAYIDKKFGKEE